MGLIFNANLVMILALIVVELLQINAQLVLMENICSEQFVSVPVLMELLKMMLPNLVILVMLPVFHVSDLMPIIVTVVMELSICREVLARILVIV